MFLCTAAWPYCFGAYGEVSWQEHITGQSPHLIATSKQRERQEGTKLPFNYPLLMVSLAPLGPTSSRFHRFSFCAICWWPSLHTWAFGGHSRFKLQHVNPSWLDALSAASPVWLAWAVVSSLVLSSWVITGSSPYLSKIPWKSLSQKWLVRMQGWCRLQPCADF